MPMEPTEEDKTEIRKYKALRSGFRRPLGSLSRKNGPKRE